jgi:hypothetical protein
LRADNACKDAPDALVVRIIQRPEWVCCRPHAGYFEAADLQLR